MKRVVAMLSIGLVLVGAAAVPLWHERERAPEVPLLRSAAAASAPITPFQLRLLAAESTYWRSEYDSARIAWTDLRVEAVGAADSANVAEIETWLGLAAWRLGDYDGARKHGETGLSMKQRLHLDDALPRSYNALGLLAWNEGRLPDALTLFTAGEAAATRVGDRVTEVKLAGNVGLVDAELAHYDRARAGFERAHKMAIETGETRLQGNALTNIGMLDIRVGDAASAVPRLLAARALYAQVDWLTGEQNALGQLTTAYAALGDLQRAFTTLDSANVLAGKHELRQDIASNLEIMGDLYHEAGDGRKAVQHYELAQKLNRELGLEVEQGTVARKIAVVQQGMGVTKAAELAAGEAARIHERLGAAFEELKDRLLILKIDTTENTRQLQRAQQLVRTIGTPAARADLALARARIAERHGAFRDVLELVEPESLDIVSAGFDAEAEAFALKAIALAHEQRPVDAAQAALASVEALERARMSLSSGLLRASFVARRAELYERVIAAQLLVGRPDDAFYTAELARTRDLGGFDTGASVAARAALGRVRDLNDDINKLDAEGEDQAVKRELLSKELAEARAGYETVLARSTWRSHAGPGTSAIAPIAHALRPDEIVLEYFVGRDHVYAFAITPDGLRAERLAVTTPALLTRVRLARAALSHEGGAGIAVLSSLYDDLMRPFAAELSSANHVFVVPHAALTYLPYAALSDARTGRYAIEKHTIQYLPAAAELPRIRSLPPVTGHPRAVIMQPFPSQLPGTRAEARAVKTAWRGSRVIAKGRATTDAMRAAIGSDAIVHVSSHGAMDARSPLFSFVAFAPSGGDAGRFEIHDVFATRVRSPLVFLSGCETGLGAASGAGYETGDDASTFSQALLAAGARAVVTTAWRIEDQSAAAVAERFYLGLGDYGAAEALARAQRTLLRSRQYGDPFYWAPYLLTGEVEWGQARPPAS